MGEGGAVFTNSDELAEIAVTVSKRDCYCKTGWLICKNGGSLGELPYGYDHKYIYSHCGYNLKITDMQAACGVAQLNRLPDLPINGTQISNICQSICLS